MINRKTIKDHENPRKVITADADAGAMLGFRDLRNIKGLLKQKLAKSLENSKKNPVSLNRYALFTIS